MFGSWPTGIEIGVEHTGPDESVSSEPDVSEAATKHTFQDLPVCYHRIPVFTFVTLRGFVLFAVTLRTIIALGRQVGNEFARRLLTLMAYV